MTSVQDVDVIEYMGLEDREQISSWVQGRRSAGEAMGSEASYGPDVDAHRAWQEAYLHRWFCRYPQAGAAAAHGVRLSRSAPDRQLEAMCRREVGLAARALGDYGQARGELEQALVLFEALGATQWQVHTMGNLATLCWYEGAPEKSLDLARQALDRCQSIGLATLRRLPLTDMGAAAVGMGLPDLARQCLHESLTLSRQARDRAQEVLCHTHLGWLAVRLRRPGEAESHFRAGLALAEAIGSCTEQSWLLAGLAESERLAGQVEAAWSHARQADERARRSGAVYDQKLAGWVLGHLRGA